MSGGSRWRQLLFWHEGFGQAIPGAEFRQDLRSEAVAGGFWGDIQAAQAVGEPVAGEALRMIRAEEPLLEAEELLVGRLAVIEDIGGLTAKVDLDAPEHERKRILKKAVVILEGDLAGVFVDFDDVSFVWVSVDAGGTENINSKDGRKLLRSL